MAVHKSRVLHRSLRETPPRAVGGEGVWLIAEDGRRILDGSGGAAVSCLGHQHPRVVDALARQASKLAYAHTSFFSSEPAEALAELLVGDEPGGLAYAYFVSGGSEAIEASIKLARQYFIERGEPRRQRFIARRQSYHGNTLGALAAGGSAWRREPHAPLLSSAFSHVTLDPSSWAVARSLCSLRPMMTTCSLAWAKAAAMACPIPLFPPVITTTRCELIAFSLL